MPPADAKRTCWTSRQLLAWTTNYLASKGVEDARLSAEMLLAHVLGVPRIKLYTDLDRPASELERVAFRGLVERAARHEPVDYLVGRAPFFSLSLRVTRDVLIPRPSTETLVEHVIQHCRRTPGFHAPVIADIGTGSGAIAIVLAKHVPNSRVIATDVSPAALAVARQNAEEQGVADRVEFLEGELLAPLRQRSMHVRYLVSNPPYISDEEWEAVAPNVKDYEPQAALRGGVDGLKFIRPLIAGAHEWLERPGQLVIEIGAAQKDAVLQLAAEAGFTNVRVLADHEGLPRVLVADFV